MLTIVDFIANVGLPFATRRNNVMRLSVTRWQRKIFMKYYEFAYLTRQDTDETGAKSLQDKLVALIEAKKGIIVDLPKAYKKRLTFRIKKQDAAYVNSVLFQMETGPIVDFKKETDVMAEILRGLIISYDPERLKREALPERFKVAEKSADTAPEIAITKPAVEIKKEEKVEEPKKEVESKTEEKKEETKEEAKEEKPKRVRKTKIKAELRDIEEKLEEILK